MLGNKLRLLREQKDYTQGYVADTLGISRVNYNRYEKNEREPDYSTLKKIADFFNVTTDELLGRTVQQNGVTQNKKIPKDLKKILEEEEVTLNGRMVSEEEKEQMLRVLEALYWDAKDKNKRK